MAKLCLVLTVLYVAGLILALVGMEWVGERNAFFAFCLFLPPLVWLAPLASLMPACLLIRPTLCLVHLVCAAAVLLGHMDLRWSPRPAPAGDLITVVTNNIHGRPIAELLGFLTREQPDILAFQAAGGRGIAEIQARFPAWHHAATGEFAVLSRFPITACEPFTAVVWADRPVAATFTIKIREDLEVVLYNIHLPTPRHKLGILRGRGFRAEFLRGGGIYTLRNWRKFGDGFRQRLGLAEDLIASLDKETRPCLLVGDFNCPAHGQIYRAFAQRYTDAFKASGRGYGFTFPGRTRNPLALFGPWLRLDYVFASQHWQPVRCRVERTRRTKHRAVSASFGVKK